MDKEKIVDRAIEMITAKGEDSTLVKAAGTIIAEIAYMLTDAIIQAIEEQKDEINI